MTMPNITIYTKQTCPYCIAAKDLLRKKNAAFDEISVDGNYEQQKAMSQRANGRTTVPQIFIGSTHVGGCDDLYALEAEGKLDALVQGS
jgi:glutaredoxin 3